MNNIFDFLLDFVDDKGCLQNILALEKLVEDKLIQMGMQPKRAVEFYEKIQHGWRISKDSVSRKLWALNHGYLPDRILLYQLSEENYRNYLSDLDYFLMHPLNNHFAFWINDKLTLKYVLPKEFIICGKKIKPLPDYYLYVENDGRYSFLMDSPQDIAHDEFYLLNLLKQKKELAMKPSNGEGGFGFVKVQFVNNKIIWNSREISKEEFQKRKDCLNGYIITEYCHQHSELAKVWPNSECTLRVVAGKMWNQQYEGGKENVFISYARFGTSLSRGTSNLSSGGVGVPFDYNTGEYINKFYAYRDHLSDSIPCFTCHPDTKVELTNQFLPNIEIVKGLVKSVCGYLSSLSYFGFDIIVTEKGAVLCEINSMPSLDYEQVMAYPIWQNVESARFFRTYLK